MLSFTFSPILKYFFPNFKIFEVKELNPIALRNVKIVCNFGLSECNRVYKEEEI